MCFLVREKKGVDMAEWIRGGGAGRTSGRGKHNQNIYYMKKSKIKNKNKKDKILKINNFSNII